MGTFAGTCDDDHCSLHFHAEDAIVQDGKSGQQDHEQLADQPSVNREPDLPQSIGHEKRNFGSRLRRVVSHEHDPNDIGFRRIMRNFTPS